MCDKDYKFSEDDLRVFKILLVANREESYVNYQAVDKLADEISRA
jgi:hypothetical protein